MNQDDAPKTIAEAAEHLNCSPWTLRDRVTRGEVPHHRRGRVKGVYFTREDLDQITLSQARPTQATKGVRNSGRSGSTASPAPAAIPEEFARLKHAR